MGTTTGFDIIILWNSRPCGPNSITHVLLQVAALSGIDLEYQRCCGAAFDSITHLKIISCVASLIMFTVNEEGISLVPLR